MTLATQLFRRMGFEVIASADGVEAFSEMRRINPGVPTLLCSGYNEQTAVNRFAGKGLAGFIRKPYTCSVLSAAVKQAVAKD